MAKAIDRLEFVTYCHQGRIGSAQGLDQVELESIGVLELIDHDLPEAASVVVTDPSVVLEQVPGPDLEVFEIEQ